MQELIQEYSFSYHGEDGTSYALSAWGEPRSDGTWEGWIEFVPIPRPGYHRSRLRTRRETSQPNREALAYWASGLEPIYFEGAFARASGPAHLSPATSPKSSALRPGA